ncbi:MAG: zf-HC2 domain-containing protein [Planctomycetota bacterium]
MSLQSQENSCGQCRALLSDYVDRELSEGERAMVERHLSTCARCGTESVRLMGLKKIVQHWDGVKSSGAFHQVVLQQMIRESQQMPAGQFKNAAERERALANTPAAQDVAEKRLPPAWILLAAATIAVAVYYLVLIIRGLC